MGGEDPLKKGMATHSSALAWRIPWTEPGRLQYMGLQCQTQWSHTLTHVSLKQQNPPLERFLKLPVYTG